MARTRPDEEWSNLLALFERFEEDPAESMLYHDGYRTTAYSGAEVWRRGRSFAATLRELSIGKGEKAVFWSENRPEWVFAFWGCVLEGVIAVPVDSRASAEFARRVAAQVKARLVLTGDDVGAAGRTGAPELRLSELSWVSAPGWVAAHTPERGDVVEIVFTSGSTGDPKGVVITHGNLLANITAMEGELRRYTKFVRLLAPVRVVNLLPFSHLFGQQMGLFLPVLTGASVVLPRTYNPREIVRRIQRSRAAALVIVPKMLEMLEEFLRREYPGTSGAEEARGPWPRRWARYSEVHRRFGWRFCLLAVGAAPLEKRSLRFWSGLGFAVTQGYGLTETAPIISFDDPLSAVHGTVGRPLPGVELRIAPDGEILVRGENVFSGYYEAPEKTAAAFDEEGWFHTGDLGSLDASGRLTVLGRKKDLIVTAEGLKVFPEDVEAVVRRLPGVKDAAAFGTDCVRVTWILEPDVSAEDLMRQANAGLETHQRIRSFHVWPGDELPRTEATGKLRRAEIERVMSGGAAAARRAGGDKTLDDLGLSSLERVELMLEIEQRAGVRFGEGGLGGDERLSEILARTAEAEAVIPFPAWSRALWARALRYLLLNVLVFPLTRLTVWRHVAGMEQLKTLTGPVILAANHQSHLDTPVLLLSLPPRLRYRVAPAMWKERFDAYFHPERHGWAERLKHTAQYWLACLVFNGYPLPQTEAGAGQSIRYAGELLDDGYSLLVFPEGARSGRGEMRPFQPGVAMMAQRLRVPVVPARIVGVQRILPPRAWLPRPGRAEIRFGPPRELQGHDYAALARELEKETGAL